MTRQEMIEKLAEYFDIEPNEDGEYDLDDYEWTAGCRFNGSTWLNLKNIINCLAEDE